MPAGATPDLRKTQDVGPLSLRESAEVRGNETPPTKTAGRILPAQLDWLRESKLAFTSGAEPVDGRRARGRKRIGVSSVPSPSPRPLPWGTAIELSDSARVNLLPPPARNERGEGWGEGKPER